MLLEKPGELVVREELREKLWPKTIVDFDHGLNKAISKVRDALGDSVENPRFIETVASRGYRFLADVTVVQHGTPETSAEDPARRKASVYPAPPRWRHFSKMAGPCIRLGALRRPNSAGSGRPP